MVKALTWRDMCPADMSEAAKDELFERLIEGLVLAESYIEQGLENINPESLAERLGFQLAKEERGARMSDAVITLLGIEVVD